MSAVTGMKILLRAPVTYRNNIRFLKTCLHQTCCLPVLFTHSVPVYPHLTSRSLSTYQKSLIQRLLSSNHVVMKRYCSEKLAEKSSEESSEKFQKKKGIEGKVIGPITWKSLLISATGCILILLYFRYVKSMNELEMARERNKSMGKAAIGGYWELVDFNGEKRTSNDYKGKWILMYFGFTHCPDICPDEIEKMCEAVNVLEKTPGTKEVVPLFITVDPERDSKEAVKKYCAEFSPKLLGLTGSKEQIESVSKTFRVYYSQGPKDEDGDYIVDHTIVMYLINPNGEFTDYYGKDKTALNVAKSISQHMKVFAQT